MEGKKYKKEGDTYLLVKKKTRYAHTHGRMDPPILSVATSKNTEMHLAKRVFLLCRGEKAFNDYVINYVINKKKCRFLVTLYRPHDEIWKPVTDRRDGGNTVVKCCRFLVAAPVGDEVL